MNTRFCQPSQESWNNTQPADNKICAAFLATNPRLIPQNEYNLGDTYDRAVTHSRLFSNSTDPPAGWKDIYQGFPDYVTDCTFSIIAQLKKVIAFNDRKATSQFLNWHPFLLDLFEDLNNLHQHIKDPATSNNSKLPDEDSNRPPAPKLSTSTSLSPSNSLTLGMIEASPCREHGVIKDLTVHLSDTFIKSHSDTYCEYISLQSTQLRDKFLTDHPSFSVERSIANDFFNSCEIAEDNPYSIYFARQTLVSNLEALYTNTTATALAQSLQVRSVNTLNTDTDLLSSQSITPRNSYYKDYTEICPPNLQSISPLKHQGLVRYIYQPEPNSHPPTATESPSILTPPATVFNMAPLDKYKSDNTIKTSCT